MMAANPIVVATEDASSLHSPVLIIRNHLLLEINLQGLPLDEVLQVVQLAIPKLVLQPICNQVHLVYHHHSWIQPVLHSWLLAPVDMTLVPKLTALYQST